MARWSERARSTAGRRAVGGVPLRTVHEFMVKPSDVMFMCCDCEGGSMVMRPRHDGCAVDVFFPLRDEVCEHIEAVMPTALSLWGAYVARRLDGEPMPIYLESDIASFQAATWRWVDALDEDGASGE